MTRRVLHQQTGTLTPTADTAPIRVQVDESVRLRQIRALVEANNRSTMSTNRIICQIYKESTFNAQAGAGSGGHNALGLMQMQRQAVRQVYKYRVQRRLGHMPSDAQTAAAFAQGGQLYDSGGLLDEATNIQVGTDYLQYWLDTKSTEELAYIAYRGTHEAYYHPIIACAAQLNADPDNVQILHQLHR